MQLDHSQFAADHDNAQKRFQGLPHLGDLICLQVPRLKGVPRHKKAIIITYRNCIQRAEKVQKGQKVRIRVRAWPV